MTDLPGDAGIDEAILDRMTDTFTAVQAKHHTADRARLLASLTAIRNTLAHGHLAPGDELAVVVEDAADEDTIRRYLASLEQTSLGAPAVRIVRAGASASRVADVLLRYQQAGDSGSPGGGNPATRKPSGRGQPRSAGNGPAGEGQPGGDGTEQLAAHVSTPSGQVIRLTEGNQLVFGRGPEVDLAISGGKGLSRRAGVIAATPDGAWIANISKTHALYVAGDGYRIRLPRVEGDGDPAGGWLVHAGTAMVGSRSMLDDGLQIAVTVPGRHRRPPTPDVVTPAQSDGEGTVLPLYLDPKTKLFLVALMWCRPWLADPGAAAPLPRTPEIARSALEVTGAHHELERFDSDPEFRDRLSARVAEHLKVLRRKITDCGLAGPEVRLSDEVAVRILIEHGIVGPGDLRLLSDPAWCSRQKDRWESGRLA